MTNLWWITVEYFDMWKETALEVNFIILKTMFNPFPFIFVILELKFFMGLELKFYWVHQVYKDPNHCNRIKLQITNFVMKKFTKKNVGDIILVICKIFPYELLSTLFWQFPDRLKLFWKY